jgi:hypothetical protein
MEEIHTYQCNTFKIASTYSLNRLWKLFTYCGGKIIHYFLKYKSLLGYSTLMIEAAHTSETSVYFNKTTRSYMLEG